MDAAATELLSFWREAGPSRWFNGGAAFDDECRTRFEHAHLAAARGEHAGWMAEADSALALLLLLDQIPRNIWRGSAHAFATDGLARRYAREAIDAGFDTRSEPALRGFFYLPFEHSETMADQHRSVEQFATLGDKQMYDYALKHREVIERFGRFPHRNAALGRVSTPEERAWLDTGGGF